MHIVNKEQPVEQCSRCVFKLQGLTSNFLCYTNTNMSHPFEGQPFQLRHCLNFKDTEENKNGTVNNNVS